MTGLRDSELASIYCGTSGFAYESWRPGFYPEKLAAGKFLEHYGTRLNAVEANYTYRRIAAKSTFDKWMACTPAHFQFLPKAHMKITHVLKLENADEFTRVFLDSLEPLQVAGRLGPVLFQLPPSLKADTGRLRDFLGALPRNIRAAFEFRHPSWFQDEVYSCLGGANAALCIAENEDFETPEVVTADFVYFRLRKPGYSEDELQDLSRRIREHRASGRTVYAIFKHEESPSGALNAERVLAQAKDE